MRANREYELSVRKAGLEIATREIALFWDTEPGQTGRLARALRSDLAQLESAEFLAKWRRWQSR